VIAVQVTDGSGESLHRHPHGMAIRFHEADVAPMGRTAYGVRGITLARRRLRGGDGGRQAGGTLLTVTEHGFGKRTEIEEYRVQSRGGVGIINIATTTKNGLVVGVAFVQAGDEILLISQQGMIIRMQTDDVRSIGRATQGVTLINMENDDKVVSIARLVEKEEEEDGRAPEGGTP
jgi:DNA gyrase subunit A